MKLDAAKAKITEIALEELGKELTQMFNAMTGGVQDASVHFENGLKMLVIAEAKALEIVSRILKD
jgi:hypothetical protein